jgi:hypothetical protein
MTLIGPTLILCIGRGNWELSCRRWWVALWHLVPTIVCLESWSIVTILLIHRCDKGNPMQHIGSVSRYISLFPLVFYIACLFSCFVLFLPRFILPFLCWGRLSWSTGSGQVDRGAIVSFHLFKFNIIYFNCAFTKIIVPKAGNRTLATMPARESWVVAR